MLVGLASTVGVLGVTYAVFRAWQYPIVVGVSPTHPTPAFGLLTTWAYVERFVFPWPQTFFHRPLLAGLDGSLVPMKFLVLGALTVLGMLALSVRAWRRDRPAFWLLVATVALLGPLLNFTDAGVGVTTSDRFLYLPLLSFSWRSSACGGLRQSAGRSSARWC